MRKQLDKAIIFTQNKVAGFVQSLTAKKHGDSQVVVALVLIAVAIGLCIIFRNQVKDIINGLSSKIGNTVNSLADGTVNNA